VLGKRENDPASHAGLIGKEPWVRPYDGETCVATSRLGSESQSSPGAADMTFEVIPWLKSIAPGIPIVIKGVGKSRAQET
jgi:hypothetical protein